VCFRDYGILDQAMLREHAKRYTDGTFSTTCGAARTDETANGSQDGLDDDDPQSRSGDNTVSHRPLSPSLSHTREQKGLTCMMTRSFRRPDGTLTHFFSLEELRSLLVNGMASWRCIARGACAPEVGSGGAIGELAGSTSRVRLIPVGVPDEAGGQKHEYEDDCES